MAKILSKSGISTLQIVRPWHVTQSIDAFLGTDAYDITLSGSMTITGSVLLNGLSSTTQTNILTYNTSTGQLFYTSSSAIGGSTSAAGNNYEIQFNSASAFQANSSFKFNYLSSSLEHGTSVIAEGEYSHAEGLATNASGSFSHAEGAATFAAGTVDHAEGYQTTASSVGWPAGGGAAAAAHAEGYNTIAYGIASHAEGYATLVSASFSHAEGYGTIANGSASHAEGFLTTASGDYSHAAGYGTHATGSGIGQSVIGWFNEPVTGHGDFIIGNGTSFSSRSNLLHASGSLVTVTGNISSSGTVTMLTASIGGGIFTSASLSAGGGGSGAGFPFTGDAVITGSLVISSSATSQSLSVIGSGSTVFDVIGSVGTLFSVDDDLTGTLFTTNDISGFPVLEASASGEVFIGKSPQSLYTTAVIGSNTANVTQSIYGLSTSSYAGAFFEYTAFSGSHDARAGSIMAIWSGSSVNFTETTTTDFGDTSNLLMQVAISQSQAQIQSYSTTAGYKIKTIVKAI